jgi:hypothetical protein
MKLEFSGQVSDKYSNIKFNKNSIRWEPSCSMWRGEQMDRQRDVTKLIVTVCNFANVPKMDT